jgi:glycosyltransferase involved in cell wall biosynthesis
MLKGTRISVIIPTFNSGMFLAKTLSTVYKQTYKPYEVIVVDGGSTDATPGIIDAYGAFITTFISERDRGQLDAVQKGIKVAKGDILYWLNADDAVMPGTFECAANTFESDTSVEIIFGDNYWFDEERRRIGVAHSVRHLSFWDQFLFYGQLQVEAFFWRRELSHKALPFDTSLRVYTDYSFFLPIRYGTKCRWVPSRLGAFRVHSEQMSTVQHSKGCAERELVKERMRQRMCMSDEEFRKLRRRHAPHYYIYQKMLPKTVSAVRFMLRKGTGDFHRKRFARFFFEEWLTPPASIGKRLRGVSAGISGVGQTELNGI